MKVNNEDRLSADSDELDFPKVSNVSIKKNSTIKNTLINMSPLTELEPASPDPLTILYQAEPDTNDTLSILEKNLENRSNSKDSNSNNSLKDDVKEKNINKKNPISEKNYAIIESLLNRNPALQKLNPPVNQIVAKKYVKMQSDEISLNVDDNVCVVASDGKRSYGIVEGTGLMGFFDSSCLKDTSSKSDIKREILQKDSSSSIPLSDSKEIPLEFDEIENIKTSVLVRRSQLIRERSCRIIGFNCEAEKKMDEAISNHPDHKRLDRPTFYIVKIQNTAKVEDELDLNINEKVCVYASNETTCLGYSQKTGQIGIFPNECILESNNQNDPNLTAENFTEFYKYSLAGRRINALRKWKSTIELTK